MDEVDPANIPVKSESTELPPLLDHEEEYTIKLESLFDNANLEGESLVIKSEDDFNYSEDGNSTMSLPDPSATISQSAADTAQAPKECTCIICDVYEYGFFERPMMEKCSIIKNGRLTPKMETVTNFNKFYFEKYCWLTSCATKPKLFCWPCLLFVRQKHKFQEGFYAFSDMNRFHHNVKRHAYTKSHLTAVIEEKTFFVNDTTPFSNSRSTLDREKHNKLVTNNRNIIKRLIDIACYFGQHKISSSERQEPQDYLGLIELLAKFDNTFQHQIGDWMSTLKDLGETINRDLGISLSRVVFNRIKKEIAEAHSFVTIILSEATYVKRNNESIAVIVRYLNPDGDLQERFIGFRNVANRTSTAIYEIICDVVDLLDCKSKLVAVSYDGATILTEEFKELNKTLQDKYEHVNFVHYHGHKLNVILYQSVKSINDCNYFFYTLKELGKYLMRIKFSEMTSRCWDFDGPLVRSVCVYRERLIELFRDIIAQNQFDFKTINSARGYLELFEEDFNFNFLLIVFSEIYLSCDLPCYFLQDSSSSLQLSAKHVQHFVDFLSEAKRNFKVFYSSVKILKDWGQTDAKRSKGCDGSWIRDRNYYYKELFDQILNVLLTQLTTRFDGLQNICKYGVDILDKLSGKAFIPMYGHLFDMVLLRTQFKAILESSKVTKKSSARELLVFLKETGLTTEFQEVAKLCELDLSLPLTKAPVVGHPALERVYSYVNNSESLKADYSIFYIEIDYVKELSQTDPNFYDEAIDEFAIINKIFDLQF